MAPEIGSFKDDRKAANVCRTFAGIVLGYSLCTRVKWVVVKVIPYKNHVAVDLASGVAALAITQSAVTVSNKQDRNTFLVMGAVGITASILSLIGTGYS